MATKTGRLIETWLPGGADHIIVLHYVAPLSETASPMDLAFALEEWRGIVQLQDGRLRIRCTVGGGTGDRDLDAIRAAIERWASDAGMTIEPSAVTVQSKEDYDASVLHPEVPPLVGISELAARLGVTSQRASEIAREGRFGPPIARLSATPVWSAATVDAVLQGTHGATQWTRRPGRPRSSTKSKNR